MGKALRMDSRFDLVVTGILKDYPANTDTKIDLFLSRASIEAFYPGVGTHMAQDWDYISSTTQSYVWLPKGVLTEAVEADLSRMPKAHFSADVASAYQFHLQPLREVHFDGRYGASTQKSLLLTLGIAGLFLVLIACFNFINMATAQSVKRAKEIGTRKVLGGSTSMIFWQFITETTSKGFQYSTLIYPYAARSDWF